MVLCTSHKRLPRNTVCPLFKRVTEGQKFILEAQKALATADRISASVSEITTILSHVGFQQESASPPISDIIGGRLTVINSHSLPFNAGQRIYRALYKYDLTKKEYTVGIDEVTPDPSFSVRISVDDKRIFHSMDATGITSKIGDERIPEAAVTQEFSHLLESRPDLHRLFGETFKELFPLRSLTLRARVLEVKQPGAPVPRSQGILPRRKAPGLGYTGGK